MQNAVQAEVTAASPPALRAVPADVVPADRVRADPYAGTVARTRSYLMTVAARAMEVAAVEDDAADAMGRLARQTFLMADRDRLFVLAERSRTHAENQRRLARRLWERVASLQG